MPHRLRPRLPSPLTEVVALAAANAAAMFLVLYGSAPALSVRAPGPVPAMADAGAHHVTRSTVVVRRRRAPSRLRPRRWHPADDERDQRKADPVRRPARRSSTTSRSARTPQIPIPTDWPRNSEQANSATAVPRCVGAICVALRLQRVVDHVEAPLSEQAQRQGPGRGPCQRDGPAGPPPTASHQRGPSTSVFRPIRNLIQLISIYRTHLSARIAPAARHRHPEAPMQVTRRESRRAGSQPALDGGDGQDQSRLAAAQHLSFRRSLEHARRTS